MISNNGARICVAAGIALAIPLLYVFHSQIIMKHNDDRVVMTQMLKPPTGPVRWNPFQSKAATDEYEMMKGFDNSELPPVTLIDRDEFEEILDVLHEDGREKSKYVVIDVRSEEEIERTGMFHEDVVNLPMHCVTMRRAFAMNEEEFREAFGFDKPTMEETVVFTCKTGKSSQMAAEMAAMEGYKLLLNYMGGANEWFS